MVFFKVLNLDNPSESSIFRLDYSVPDCSGFDFR